MARIRSIRPEFWSDTKICSLPALCRLFYVSLWNFADDEGRGRAIPKELVGFAFPFDDDIEARHVREWLDALYNAGRILLYEFDGMPYFQIVHWGDHQTVNRPTPSRFPAPEGYTVSQNETHECLSEDSVSDSGTTHECLSEDSVSDSVRVRGVGIRNLETGTSLLGNGNREEGGVGETQVTLPPTPPPRSPSVGKFDSARFAPLSQSDVRDLERQKWTLPEIAEGCVRIRGQTNVRKPAALLHATILPAVRHEQAALTVRPTSAPRPAIAPTDPIREAEQRRAALTTAKRAVSEGERAQWLERVDTEFLREEAKA